MTGIGLIAFIILLFTKSYHGFLKFFFEKIRPPERKIGLQRLSREEKLVGSAVTIMWFGFLLSLFTSCASLEGTATGRVLQRARVITDQKIAEKLYQGELPFCREVRRRLEAEPEKKWFGLAEKKREPISDETMSKYRTLCR